MSKFGGCAIELFESGMLSTLLTQRSCQGKPCVRPVL